MLGTKPVILLGVLILSVVKPVGVCGFTGEEHHRLAEGALLRVVGKMGGTVSQTLNLPLGDGAMLEIPSNLLPDMDFPDLSRHFAKDDRRYSRYHHRLQTVQQQLALIKKESLEHLVHEGPFDTGELQSVESARLGVVGNYFLHHWMALNAATKAGQDPDRRGTGMTRALILEARAQGYLADAFSASHMLMPPRTVLSRLYSMNLKILHHSYRATGLFVMDSRNNVWQTFGDGLLFWYPAATGYVQTACESSLWEVMASFYKGLGHESSPPALETWLADEYVNQDAWARVAGWLIPRDADEYYRVLMMPSLLRIPAPITAAWSVRSKEFFLSGPDVRPPIHKRIYYPQLRETGLHDPGLEIREIGTLYTRDTIPEWLRLPKLETRSPQELVRADPEVASVRYVQPLWKPPSYVGALLIAGPGRMVTGPGIGGFLSVGAGWAFVDELIQMRWLPSLRRGAFELKYRTGWDGSDGEIVTGVVAFQLAFPTVLDLHVETGWALGVGMPMEGFGPTVAVGATLAQGELPVAYLGTMLRIKYEISYLDRPTGGAFLELVIY